MSSSNGHPTIHVRAFGVLEVRRDRSLLPAFPTRYARGLFAFLALHRDRLHARERLQALFWSEAPPDSARKYLRTALWRIRSVLEPDERLRGAILRVRGPEVGLQPDLELWVDVGEFERCLDHARGAGEALLGSDRVASLTRAVELYRGDLLEGLYDEWCLLEQDRLRARLRFAIDALIRHHLAAGDAARAIDFGERLLAIDPLEETVHRYLMCIHYQLGSRTAALRQYRRCARFLEAAYGIAPMQATRDLRAVILAGGDLPVSGTDAAPSSSGPDHLPDSARMIEPSRRVHLRIADFPSHRS